MTPLQLHFVLVLSKMPPSQVQRTLAGNGSQFAADLLLDCERNCSVPVWISDIKLLSVEGRR
jgi:hypothetical protein